MDLRATLQELEGIAHQHRAGCWLRVTVPLVEKDPDINRKVRDLLPNALIVKAELPEAEQQRTIRLAEGASPAEHYSAYHMHEHQAEPGPDVVETFQQLHAAASGLEG
ncbi:MAG: exonuclease SbcCD subunit D C-terminal domain-containing protein [bacterium]